MTQSKTSRRAIGAAAATAVAAALFAVASPAQVSAAANDSANRCSAIEAADGAYIQQARETASGTALVALGSGGLYKWDVSGTAPRQTGVTEIENANGIATHPNKELAYVITDYSAISVVRTDLAAPRVLRTLPSGEGAGAVETSPDGKYLYVLEADFNPMDGDAKPAVRVFSLRNAQRPKSIGTVKLPSPHRPYAIAVSPDGKTLVALESFDREYEKPYGGRVSLISIENPKQPKLLGDVTLGTVNTTWGAADMKFDRESTKILVGWNTADEDWSTTPAYYIVDVPSLSLESANPIEAAEGAPTVTNVDYSLDNTRIWLTTSDKLWGFSDSSSDLRNTPGISEILVGSAGNNDSALFYFTEGQEGNGQVCIGTDYFTG